MAFRRICVRSDYGILAPKDAGKLTGKTDSDWQAHDSLVVFSIGFIIEVKKNKFYGNEFKFRSCYVVPMCTM